MKDGLLNLMDVDKANEFAWEYDNGEQDWTMKRFVLQRTELISTVPTCFHVFTQQ